MSTQPKSLFMLFVVLALLLAGCGPTNQDVIEQYTPQYTQLRADLRDIGSTLDPASGEIAVTQPLDPRPVYTAGSKEIQNTDIMMLDHLFDPDQSLNLTGLDLTLSNYLLRLLRWTGPASPMQPSALDAPVMEGLDADFEQALQVRYLGVAAVVQHDPAVAVSEAQFTGGSAEVVGFLVDMQTRQVLCTFRITAAANQEVSYTYEEGDSKTQALERFANSTLWSNARAAFIEKMNQVCGGDFALDQ